MDNKIIQHVLEGQKDEFNKLIMKYYNELFRFVYNQVNDVETTKDLLQEIFMRIFTKLKTFNPEKASFRTWMYRLSNNYCINYHKKNKLNTIKDIDLNMFGDESDILESLINHEDVKLILSVMKQQLSNKHYEIVTLYYFSELSIDEIAETYHLANKTIRNVVSLSISKVKKALGVSDHE